MGHGVWVTICGYVTGCVMVRFMTTLLMRYGGALRYVTGICYSMLGLCVTVCDVGVLRQCVMVRYGGMLRCVTVRYAQP